MGKTDEPQQERRVANAGRRADDIHPRPELLDILMQIHANQLRMDKKLEDHMRDETKEIGEQIGVYMASAFPNGDPDGHKKHHEALIEKASASAAFWKDMRNSTAKWGILGFLGWVILSLWSQFLHGPGK